MGAYDDWAVGQLREQGSVRQNVESAAGGADEGP